MLKQLMPYCIDLYRKKTEAKTLTKEIADDAITKLNNLPRKRHGFRTRAVILTEKKIYLFGALRA